MQPLKSAMKESEVIFFSFYHTGSEQLFHIQTWALVSYGRNREIGKHSDEEAVNVEYLLNEMYMCNLLATSNLIFLYITHSQSYTQAHTQTWECQW